MVCDIPDFGRCCFCLPLRRGIVTFGYFNVVWSVLMISMLAHYNPFFEWAYFYSSTVIYLNWEASVTVYSFDIIFSLLLIFGAHLKNTILLKAFYFYTLLALVTLFIVEIVASNNTPITILEVIAFAGLLISTSIHLYIVMLVRSLIKKIETTTSEGGYQNQLHQIVNVDMKADSVNSSTVMSIE